MLLMMLALQEQQPRTWASAMIPKVFHSRSKGSWKARGLELKGTDTGRRFNISSALTSRSVLGALDVHILDKKPIFIERKGKQGGRHSFFGRDAAEQLPLYHIIAPQITVFKVLVKCLWFINIIVFLDLHHPIILSSSPSYYAVRRYHAPFLPKVNTPPDCTLSNPSISQ